MSADNGYVIHVKRGDIYVEHYFASDETPLRHTGKKFETILEALRYVEEMGSEYGAGLCECES